MSQIRITADSVCDLSPEIIAEYNFAIMPLMVGLGEKYYEDSVNIDPVDIYKYVAESKKLPKTSARTFSDYKDFFQKVTENGDTVIHFSLSASMSSSYQNACIAAEEIDGQVYVIDSRNLSTGIGLMMIDAYNFAKEGKIAEEIVQLINDNRDNIRTSFVVDSLDYLRMGGRCSAVAALGANMLRLHPCIAVKDGKMGVGNKLRGPMSRVILQYVTEQLKLPNIRTDKIFLTHADCDEQVIAAVRAEIEKIGFDRIYQTRAGATINSHCGQGSLGVLFEVTE